MAGLEAIIVGYRDGDPRIGELWEQHGHRALPHRPCLSCGRVVWFVESGQDKIRASDPEVICEPCWARHKDEIVSNHL